MHVLTLKSSGVLYFDLFKFSTISSRLDRGRDRHDAASVPLETGVQAKVEK